MTIADSMPAVDAFVRWAHNQHATGQQSAEQLVAIAIERYAKSPALLEAFVREAFLFFAVEAVTGARPVVEWTTTNVDGDVADIDKRSPRRRAATIRRMMEDQDNPVTRFFERHPEDGIEIPLLSMTREELLAAADIRDGESIRARRRAEICRSVASRLRPGQVANDVVSEQDIASIERGIIARERSQSVRRAS